MQPVSSARSTVHAPDLGWVPIRSLSRRHRSKVRAHLLSLGPDDRYLRFGHAASDEQIGRYVERLDFGRDEIFGIFSRRLELLALAHLAYPTQPATDASPTAEFGASVAAKARGRGWGHRLFAHAVLHARNHGIDALVIHALSENRAMLRIVRNAGATVERAGADSIARLALPPGDVASQVDALVEARAAEIDYRYKLHARRASALWTAILNAAKPWFRPRSRSV